ncbi:MAG: acetyl-CoA hydrolase/transferase C-terminal domain-containing protein [Acidimicrobiales bacterium]
MYEWLDGNDTVRFLPVDIVNSPENISRNREMITINGAMSIDLAGQVIADTIGGVQFSGHRRPRGLHRRGRARAHRPLADLPAGHRHRRRRARVAHLRRSGAGSIVTTPATRST